MQRSFDATAPARRELAAMRSRMPVALLIGCAVVAVLSGADAVAKIYQCQVEGRTVYTDQPCGGLGSESDNLYVSPSQRAASGNDSQASAQALKPSSATARTPSAARSSTTAPRPEPTQAPPSQRAPVPVTGSPHPETPAPPARRPRNTCAGGEEPPCGSRAASQAAAAPGTWRLAGEYSDRIPAPGDTRGQRRRHMVTRSSYGIECVRDRTRHRVYAIDGRFSLVTPDVRGALSTSAPLFESLDAAAVAACAANGSATF